MEIRLLGVDGVEARVAMMYWGGGGKIHRDQNVLFLFSFLYQSQLHVFYILKEDCRYF